MPLSGNDLKTFGDESAKALDAYLICADCEAKHMENIARRQKLVVASRTDKKLPGRVQSEPVALAMMVRDKKRWTAVHTSMKNTVEAWKKATTENEQTACALQLRTWVKHVLTEREYFETDCECLTQNTAENLLAKWE